MTFIKDSLQKNTKSKPIKGIKQNIKNLWFFYRIEHPGNVFSNVAKGGSFLSSPEEDGEADGVAELILGTGLSWSPMVDDCRFSVMPVPENSTIMSFCQSVS